MGLEPTTAAMARRYSSQLSYTRVNWIVWIFMKNQVFSVTFFLCYFSHHHYNLAASIPLAHPNKVTKIWFCLERRANIALYFFIYFL